MFAAEAKAFVQTLGETDLISNDNLNCKMDLLTLVKVTEGSFWPVQKYKVIHCSLPELMEEENFSPDYTEEVLVEDFKITAEKSGSGGVGGECSNVGEAYINASTSSVDGLVQPVSMMTKKANVKTVVSRFKGRKIHKDSLDVLGLKEKDKLMFVSQIVYNSSPVKVIRKSTTDGSIFTSYVKMLSVFAKGSSKVETSFTVPAKSIFAYGLVEIKIEDEKLKISCEPWTRSLLDWLLGDDVSNPTVQKVKEELEMKEALLQPLADLPESTRCDLLQTLSELVEDGDNLSLLDKTLDHCSNGVFECVQSEAVSSFMDLLIVSNISTSEQDAVHMLVSALHTLPDEVPPLLTRCSPDTLRVLDQLVDGLKDGRANLPESLPVPLQEGGELRWVAEFICLNDQKLKELSDGWDRPELPPEVLLEVLCLAVQGLSLMQPTTNP
ncbi:uncharacterized protein LOC102083072 isoform X1 [Oreochromis niloticus]|uniref:uncharacterized protein LOC102083072 isoform X1 n=2 Tax=Oreochromis niloticus TaxID=8128 RepID=UPI0009053230|nr:uncharacterized protein LOC102083072 isoform X1 [Oreochromis niloticus]